MATGTVHRKLSRAVLVLLATLLATRSGVAGQCRVASAVDGDTLVCEDGRVLRLAGLRAPKPAPWESDVPFATAARTVLSRLAQGRMVAWETGAPDRHARVRAQLRRDDGLWLQEEMLRQGLAMVETQRDCQESAGALLIQEAAARDARRGVWSNRRYRVQTAEEVRGGGWRIVEGRVAQVEKRKGVAYLNFGADWRSDFTVRLAGPVLRDFAAVGRDPLALRGRRVRVRGWVDWHNGPELTPDHPAQLEVLE